jgi:hypothetical protein
MQNTERHYTGIQSRQFQNRHTDPVGQVSDWIPDEDIAFVDSPNSSSPTVGLGSTQTLTDMSTRNFHEEKRATGA